jgi:antitoxin component YwqK of YwqJK toxin-antitoxin module
MRCFNPSRSVFAFALAFVGGLVASRFAPAQDAAADSGPASDEIYLDELDPVPPPTVVTTGKVQDKYEDGSIRIDREVLKLSDDQLVNHGVFTEYYPNGQKFAEGSYNNGVHDGSWTFWHDNGQVCKTVTFVDGQADGTWEVFRADGTLQAKRTYKGNLRDGEWTTYHPDGTTPRAVDAYVEGKHEGPSRHYFANGQMQREMTYKDNLLEGVMTEWDESGRKLAEVNLTAGQRDGKFIIYRPDGTTVEHTYKNGRLLTGDPAS